MESNRDWLVRTGTLAGLLLAVFALAPHAGQQDDQNRQRVQQIDSLILAKPVHEAELKDRSRAGLPRSFRDRHIIASGGPDIPRRLSLLQRPRLSCIMPRLRRVVGSPNPQSGNAVEPNPSLLSLG